MPKSVYIDLGSHFGETVQRFVASRFWHPDFEIHAFEPNPLFTAHDFRNYPRGVMLHRKAAWVHDGRVELFVNRDRPKNTEGSSVCRGKTTGNLDYDRPDIVPCVDFDKWITSSFAPDDHIVVKSNIEGSEYAVFGTMCDNGSIQYLTKLYLKRHWRKIGMEWEEDRQFLARLRACLGLDLRTHYDF